MIVRLKGTLFSKQPPFLGIEVNGVGYGLQASLTTFAYLPDCGEAVTLYTHLLIREDAHSLFGFIDEKERELFLTLIKINGVGPKLALAILSTYDTAQLIAIIVQNDLAGLTRIPGIGKKTAERLLVELRDKVGNLDCGSVSSISVQQSPEAKTKTEAIAALESLGFKPIDAEKTIKRVYTEAMTVETLIRAALQAN